MIISFLYDINLVRFFFATVFLSLFFSELPLYGFMFPCVYLLEKNRKEMCLLECLQNVFLPVHCEPKLVNEASNCAHPNEGKTWGKLCPWMMSDNARKCEWRGRAGVTRKCTYYESSRYFTGRAHTFTPTLGYAMYKRDCLRLQRCCGVRENDREEVVAEVDA